MNNFYKNNLENVLSKLEFAKQASYFKENVKLVAVSKMVTANEVKMMFDIGQTSFGENRVQSLKQKCDELVNLEIDWHFIGRLQTNKINQLLSLKPNLIHSCSDIAMANEIDKRTTNYKPDILLQINSANESTKAGVSTKDAVQTYKQIASTCKNINLCGVMSIGAHTQDTKMIQKSFETTREIFDRLKPLGATYCSMGMSSDFELAIKCGSNLVRLGTILFK